MIYRREFLTALRKLPRSRTASGRSKHSPSSITQSSCYTKFVLKNVTITVEEETLRWARHQAAEKGTSVSKLVGQILEQERLGRPESYWKAYEEWKKIKPIPGVDASQRMSRQEVHARGR